jgi:shikimate kinase
MILDKKIILIGPMGVGKSSVCNGIAKIRKNIKYMDTDHCVEKELNSSIANIFDSQGEEAFRNQEYLCLK